MSITAVMPTYARTDVAFEKGEGSYLTDSTGRRYLDFGTGIATAGIGHCHPHLAEAIAKQAATLMHCSNLYNIPGQQKMADRLVAATFADSVFFGNSGAEANECAIKMARRYQHVSGHPERYRVITFENCFHGRTLATIAATGAEKVLQGFGPKVDGFDHVPFGDLKATEGAISNETAAIMVEAVQGEGGFFVAPDGFLEGLRKLCDKHGLLLIADEIQTGMGRTGTFLAFEQFGVKPDIATLGKSIGGGFPTAACIATAEAAKGMTAGTHGSTYGGNPLAMAAANATMDVVLEAGFMDHVQAMSKRLRAGVEAIRDRNDSLIELVRGKGLMIGLKTRVPNGEIVNKLRDAGMLTVPAGDNVVRLLPPMTVSEAEIDEALAIIEKICVEDGS
ncbi:MAG: aspartate aminotransferase family protein [Alphaproteobacteria bacterium]